MGVRVVECMASHLREAHLNNNLNESLQPQVRTALEYKIKYLAQAYP
jgi:hypothetical protein